MDKIGSDLKTDKCHSGHDYLRKYEFFLERWENESINVLELGVLKGASIKMWGEYFKKATIYGVDIDVNAKKYEGSNRKIIIRDLSQKNNLIELCKLSPTIIIDDASHWWSHQIKSFYYLFPALPHGGIFIMEDMGTSFEPYLETLYADSNVSTYDFFTALCETVISKGMAKINIKNLKEEIKELANQIEMISISSENCIIVKK